MIRPTNNRWGLFILAASLTLPLSAAELLRNGDFTSGAPVWHVPSALGDWQPIADGVAQLHPPGFGYSGAVIYQNLNVPAGADRTVTVKARLQKNFAPTGISVTLAVDCLTTGGQTRRVTLLSPVNESFGDGEFTPLQQETALPADTAKLVRFLVTKTGYGDFAIDDVSLAGTGLAAGAVPTIQSVTPDHAPYRSAQADSTITITGSGFGTVPGHVRLAMPPLDQPSPFGGAGELPVVSWADGQVVAQVTEPARSGKLWLLAGGVESDGEPAVTITSPFFTLDVANPQLAVIRGQTAEVICKVAFYNGFTTVGGVGILPTMPVPGAPTAPMTGPGGAVIRFDTKDLPAGTQAGVVQSLEDKSFARFASYSLRVVTVSAIRVIEYGQTGVRTELDAKTATSQGTIGFQFEVVDQNGDVYTGPTAIPGVPPVEVTSSDPQVVSVYPGNFGPQIFAEENGSAILTLRTPDGFTREFPVTVSAPATPRVLSLGVSPPVVPNDGVALITYGATATDNVTVGYRGFLTLVDDDIQWTDGNRSAIRTFKIQPGTPPGDYLFTAGTGGLDMTSSERVVALRVVNAPDRGAVTGNAYVLDPSAGGPDGAMGTLEFYAPDGTLAFDRSVQSYTSTAYYAGYVPPGTYRLRYVPSMATLAAQWWPNATSFLTAQDVAVAAGQASSEHDFFLGAAATEPAEVVIPPPVSADDGSLSFTLGTTVGGKTYILEFVRDLGGASWQEPARATGNGGPATLADAASADPSRFYRLRVE